jgi:hypothetical protein
MLKKILLNKKEVLYDTEKITPDEKRKLGIHDVSRLSKKVQSKSTSKKDVSSTTDTSSKTVDNGNDNDKVKSKGGNSGRKTKNGSSKKTK